MLEILQLRKSCGTSVRNWSERSFPSHRVDNLHRMQTWWGIRGNRKQAMEFILCTTDLLVALCQYPDNRSVVSPLYIFSLRSSFALFYHSHSLLAD